MEISETYALEMHKLAPLMTVLLPHILPHAAGYRMIFGLLNWTFPEIQSRYWNFLSLEQAFILISVNSRTHACETAEKTFF